MIGRPTRAPRVHDEQRGMSDAIETITLAGGCFRCVEAAFAQLRGAVDVDVECRLAVPVGRLLRRRGAAAGDRAGACRGRPRT